MDEEVVEVSTLGIENAGVDGLVGVEVGDVVGQQALRCGRTCE